MQNSRLVTSAGKALLLGAELGRGGEGVIFSLQGEDQCVKVYHNPLTSERAGKIKAMAADSRAPLLSVATWPLDLVLNNKGTAVGLMMPKAVGKRDVHELYSPKSRRTEFMRGDWRFLIRTSCNIARAFATIHQQGYVIGDVNHGSVLVGQDARVTLVDCDSFQVTVGGKTFHCDKGVETYLPPELQGKSLDSIKRTVDHDSFGLAVLIFHLLMMGRHPFAGRYSGAGEMMIPKAIEERRFAYSKNRAQFQMERPPGTPELSIVGADCASLFEEAFTTRDAGARPSAQKWLDVLGQLEKRLVCCQANEAHWYLGGLAHCPWCQMERATGSILFPFVAQATGNASLLDVAALSQRIFGLIALGPAPEIPKPAVSATDKIKEARRDRRKLQLSCLFLGLVCCGVGFLFGSISLALAGAGVGLVVYKLIQVTDTSLKETTDRLNEAAKTWHAIHNQWVDRCSGKKFEAERAKYQALKANWDRLPQERLKRLDFLQTNRRQLQLSAFLDRHRIEYASIPGIGPGRKAILASEGIETAFDVEERNLFIPSFGPSTRNKLIAWRQTIERQFVFNPSQGVDPKDIAAVEQAILSEKRKLEAALKEQSEKVFQEHAQIVGLRKSMLPRLEAALADLAQAEADKSAAA